jgi:magnesium-transporting ATPase (P-type)
MFEFVEGKLIPSKTANVVRVVSVGDRNIEIMKINQYESQFQSMSVLVRDPQADKHYVFIKGSPEMIHHYSVKKIQGFDNFVKKLSFSGYRSIGFGYK